MPVYDVYDVYYVVGNDKFDCEAVANGMFVGLMVVNSWILPAIITVLQGVNSNEK